MDIRKRYFLIFYSLMLYGIADIAVSVESYPPTSPGAIELQTTTSELSPSTVRPPVLPSQATRQPLQITKPAMAKETVVIQMPQKGIGTLPESSTTHRITSGNDDAGDKILETELPPPLLMDD